MTATDLESTAATRQFGVEGGSSILENDALDDNITEHRYKIGPDLAAFAGPGVVLTGGDAITKTIHMHDRDFVFGDGSGSGFRLTEMSVTVTKMTHPSTGRIYLSIFFNYSKTSLGWRTGAGPGQTVGVPQGLYFRNKDGGTIWSWGFPADEILVRCGDNQVFKSHHIVSDIDLSWFEVWKKVGHRFSGTLYQC